MKAITCKAMNRLDFEMIKSYGIEEAVLMEHAALRVLEVIQEVTDIAKEKFVILAGKGNNGGDAIALARLLHVLGCSVTIFVKNKDLKKDTSCESQKKIAVKMGIPIFSYETIGETEKAIFNQGTVYVDGLFGTGFKGEIQDPELNLIDEINGRKGLKVSIDIPSGINGDTGKGNCYFKSHLTVVFAYLKWAHLLNENMGSVFLGHISFDPKLETYVEETLSYLSREEIKPFFEKRKKDTHKGNYGHVGILGSDKTMMGASLLAGKAALKMGTGKVTLWAEDNTFNEALLNTLEVMVSNWKNSLDKKVDVLIIGPGLGSDFPYALEKSLEAHLGPVVMDADGFNYLKNDKIKRAWIKGPLILTPHPKEMANLMDITTKSVQENRLETVKACAKKWDCIALLKGDKTLVSDGEEVYLNVTGNPGMATAGSGDVLSGVIGSLMGQGLAPFNSACYGAFIHGLSGNLCREKLGETSLMAQDLIEFLPKAINGIKKSDPIKAFITKLEK